MITVSDGPPGAPTARIIALPELEPSASPGAPIRQDMSPWHGIRTRVQVCVGEADVSIGELLGAREQQVLKLDRTIDQPVDLTIDGQTVARGQLVAIDGHFAVRITELPVPFDLGGV